MTPPKKQRLGLGISTCLGVIALSSLLLRTAPASAPPRVAAAPAAMPQTNLLNQILDMARDARNAARDGAASALEVRNRVRSGVSSLTGQLEDMIEEASDSLQLGLEVELAGRDVFLNGDVEPFRQELIELLTAVEQMVNRIAAIGQPCSDDLIDFQRLIDVVEALPGNVLFFLYRALSVDLSILDCGLLDQIRDTVTSLGVVAQTLGETIDLGPFDFDFEVQSTCDFVLANPGLVRAAMVQVQGTALLCKGVGMVAGSLGSTEISGEFQIHGYLGGSLEGSPVNSPGATLAKIFGGVGDMLAQLASSCATKMRHCAVVGGIDDVLQGQADLATREGQDRIIESQREIKTLLEELLRRHGTRNP